MRVIGRHWFCLALLVALAGCLEDPPVDAGSEELLPATLSFTLWTEETGLEAPQHYSANTIASFRESATASEQDLLAMAGGIAVGDINEDPGNADGFPGDSWLDVVVLRGEQGAALFINQQDGPFKEQSAAFDLDVDPLASSPLLADFNGDGRVDLLLGGIGERHVQLFLNVDGERFEDATAASNLTSSSKVLSVSAGDADGDGDLDVLFARYGTSLENDAAPTELFWLNDGAAHFTDNTGRLRVPAQESDAGAALELSLTPNFVDLDGDRDSDVLLVQDRGLSSIFENTALDAGAPVFQRLESAIDIARGHGSALGDYDNDGDLDWFISGADATNSAFRGGDGNRLYENDGDGNFDDVTARAGVGAGGVAWGSCFEDFNNDGFLDLFQVNGWDAAGAPANTEDAGTPGDAGTTKNDRSRLFINQQDGTFVEAASDVGLTDNGNGRGVACLDYNHDGDVDILVSDLETGTRFYRNDLTPWERGGANYLCVLLAEQDPTQTIVGTKVTVTAGELTQTRELRVQNGYASLSSLQLHFGVGEAEIVDQVEVQWASGGESTITNWRANSCLVATHVGE